MTSFLSEGIEKVDKKNDNFPEVLQYRGHHETVMPPDINSKLHLISIWYKDNVFKTDKLQ